MIQTLKYWGRRSSVLHYLWGKLRWYTTRAGYRQIIDRIRHFGWGVQCPFCNWRGNSFFPHPEPHIRPNAICPKCSSKERHRLLYFYLKRSTNLFNQPMKVLEIAPGQYSYRLLQKLPKITYVTLDYESSLAMIRGDITTFPLLNAYFDLVICYHVLEHVPDDRCAMRELNRVLRRDGLLLVQVPIQSDVTFENPSVTDPQERLRLFGQDDHVRIYGRDFVDRLTETGFDVYVSDFAAHLPGDMVYRHGLVCDELIYACHPSTETQ